MDKDKQDTFKRIIQKMGGDSETSTFAMSVAIPKVQSLNASNTPPDQLNDLIRDYLRKNPAYNSTEILDYIRSLEGNGVIKRVTEDEIIYSDAKGREKYANISGFPDRVSHQRKKI